MNKLFCLLIFLLFTNSSNGNMLLEKLHNQISFRQNNSIQEYYRHIYQAEDYILKGHFDSSFSYYTQAFTYKASPFNRDILNAAIVADKINQFDSEYKLLKLLIEREISFNELIECGSFRNYFSEKQNQAQINKLRGQRPTYNEKFRNSLLDLVEKDQYFRKKSNAYKLYMDTIKIIDRNNIEAFKKLIIEYGYPTDEKVGVTSLKMISDPIYSLLILHQAFGPMQQINLSDIVSENILNGNLQNKSGFFFLNRMNVGGLPDLRRHVLVKVIDSTKSSSNPNNIIIIDSTDYGYSPLASESISQENEKRKQFFLDDFETNIKKLLFNFKHPEYKLGVLGSIGQGIYVKREDFDIDKALIKYQ